MIIKYIGASIKKSYLTEAESVFSKKRSYILLCLAFCGLGLTNCSDIKKTLGLDRDPPDEFAVVPRAEISLPPEYNLMPPKGPAVASQSDVIGAIDARPQEVSPYVRAKKVLLGDVPSLKKGPKGALSQGEKNFLGRVEDQVKGMEVQAKDIRSLVDEEAAVVPQADKTLVQKILFWQKTDRTKEAIHPGKEFVAVYGANPDGTVPPTESTEG